MSEVTLSAAAIARRSRSNLAFALFCLPPQRRRDMQTFYAFCRIVDDIADEPELAEEERAVGLQRWRDVVVGKAEDPDGLEASIFALTERYPISPDYLLEIIEGVSADLVKKRYQTFDELKLYCYRVACVVGLVSIEIFGYKNEGCRDYAVNLGYALQLTNILRDIGVDSKTSDRIYLPAEELERFGYGEKDLQAEVNDGRMRFQHDRARGYYEAAREALPDEDRHSMVSAEMMGQIYSGILGKMHADGFRVFEKRYRLNGLAKAWILVRSLLAQRMSR